MRFPSSAAVFLSASSLFFSPLSIEAQPKRVIAFGDSLSIGFREPGVDCNDPDGTAKGYADHLEEMLVAEGIDAIAGTAGVCGETTFAGVTRIDQVLAQQAADAMVIMEGTNDISSGNPIISVECVLANLREMADKASAANVQPVLASIIPYGPGVDGQQRNGRASRLSDELRVLAAEDGRAFADPFNFLFDMPDVFEELYDPDGFHLNETGYERLAEVFVEPVKQAFDFACTPEPCVGSDTVHCLQGGRYEVSVDWVTATDKGQGQTIPISNDTGQFWFFSPENIELVVKVLDGSCFNNRVWVFYGALSNVEYTIRVTDTETCERRVYFNPDQTFASVGDTDAFVGDDSACP